VKIHTFYPAQSVTPMVYVIVKA